MHLIETLNTWINTLRHTEDTKTYFSLHYISKTRPFSKSRHSIFSQFYVWSYGTINILCSITLFWLFGDHINWYISCSHPTNASRRDYFSTIFQHFHTNLQQPQNISPQTLFSIFCSWKGTFTDVGDGDWGG